MTLFWPTDFTGVAMPVVALGCTTRWFQLAVLVTAEQRDCIDAMVTEAIACKTVIMVPDTAGNHHALTPDGPCHSVSTGRDQFRILVDVWTD